MSSRAQPRERCGAWVKVAGYETVCMLWDCHGGACVPNRSELMNEAERLEAEAAAIHNEVLRLDAFGRWPYEGPAEDAA